MESYGVLTLLPAVLVIAFAVITKRTTEPLLIGSVVSYIIIDGIHFIPYFADAFFSVATDYDNVWLILVCGLFGSLIALLNASKGTHAIAREIGKICKTEKSTLLMSWVLGIIIFVDDYMNIMTISSCMRRISDKNKVPRESLVYVVDSTGAPTCVLLPFSTWAIFYAGAFYEQESIQALGFGNAIETYMHAIPFIFYAIIALLVVPLFAIGVIPKLGAMKGAYARTKKTGCVYSELSKCYNKNFDEAGDAKNAHVLDFLIPMGLLIAITIAVDDIFLALLASIVSCFLLYIPRRIISAKEFCDLWIKGFADMVPALAIILMALLMRRASADLNLPDYVVGHIMPYVSAKTFPAIAFLVVSGLAFITGSNWGIPAVCVPIIVPLGAAAGANLLLVMGAIVSGGVFSSHACFYSDATVMTSTSCGIENMEHAATQLPYALIALTISFVVFLVCGCVM